MNVNTYDPLYAELKIYDVNPQWGIFKLSMYYSSGCVWVQHNLLFDTIIYLLSRRLTHFTHGSRFRFNWEHRLLLLLVSKWRHELMLMKTNWGHSTLRMTCICNLSMGYFTYMIFNCTPYKSYASLSLGTICCRRTYTLS